MNVNEIRDRVLEVSHDEVAPDTTLKSKAMNWLNSAYHEMVDECMPYLTRYLQRTERLSALAGTGNITLALDVYRLLGVRDTQTNKLLKEVSFVEFENAYTGALSSVSAPTQFWLEGHILHLNSTKEVTLDVTYLPNVPDLAEGEGESTILIPKQFHSSLVWGALVWGSVYERGFSSVSDMNLFQNKWDEAKAKMKLSLASSYTKDMRVQPYGLFSA